MPLFILALLAILSNVAEAVLHQSSSPPRGWNSYDGYSCRLYEEDVKANALFMANNLSMFGYEYIVIDYGWFRFGTGFNFSCGGSQSSLQMDGYGRLQPYPPRYPSSENGQGFKPLADFIHKLGLKFGFHIMRGMPKIAFEKNLPIYKSNYTAKDAADESTPCSWNGDNWGVKNNSAGQAFYDSLIELYNEWEIDFIKMDCAYGAEWLGEIEMISKAIQKFPREIVLSMSPTDRDPRFAQQIKSEVSMYRINGDVWDVWGNIASAFTTAPGFVDLIGNPSYPDLDMLPLGNLSIRSGHGPPRQSALSQDEQKSLMTLWAIFRSPLIMGGALPALANDSFTMSLITNNYSLFINSNGANSRPVDFTLKQSAAAGDWLVTAEACDHDDPYQQWIVGSDGTIRFGYNKSLCLDVNDCGTKNGTPVLTFPCHVGSGCASGKNQQWDFESDGTIKTSLNGACLDVSDFVGPKVDTWSCNGGDNQKWSYSNETTVIRSRQAGYNLCLSSRPPGAAWTADGQNSDKYVALFNSGSTAPAEIEVSFSSIGLSNETRCSVHDVWEGGPEISMTGSVRATNVPGHGVAFYVVNNCVQV